MDEDTGLLRASVAYPLRGEASRTRLLFGTGLHFLAGVVAVGAVALVAFEAPAWVPAWLPAAAWLVAALAYVPLLGYTAAAVRELLDDEPAPPGFGDWGALLRDGRRFAAVVVVYAIPLAALAGLAAVLGVDATAGLAVAALAALYALAAAYVIPAALVTVVNQGTLSAAWNGDRLRAAVVDRRYLGRWLLAAVVAVVGGALGAVLAPLVVGFAVLFATQLAALYAVTRGVVLSLDLTLEDPPPAPASGYVPGWDEGSRRQELSEGRLGGSLLPTTPGGDDSGGGDADETPPTPGSLATTGDGGDGSTDLDRPDEGPPVGGAGSASGGSSSDGSNASTSSDTERDIEPYGEEGDEIEAGDEE